MIKNLLTVIVSLFFSLILIYIIFFIKIYYDKHHEHPNLFKNEELLNFHKNYSKKIHHLRDKDGRWDINKLPENYLFTVVKKFHNRSENKNLPNILLQGDSWIEQMLDVKPSSVLIDNFVDKNNFGLVNAGVTSFSPTLMQLQFEILEKDFNIKPNIVIGYIDQTDFGDELCRYKDKLVFNLQNNLIAVKNEQYTRATYDYTKIYNISEILLKNKSPIVINYKLTNFFIKYSLVRVWVKTKAIIKYGWNNADVSKCRFSEIEKYLLKGNQKEVDYFKQRIKGYINYLVGKNYIDRIVIVTFPHKKNILQNDYINNVSNIVDEVVSDFSNKNVEHLNFSKLLTKDKSDDSKYIIIDINSYRENDPASHLNEKHHAEIFTNTIINFIHKN